MDTKKIPEYISRNMSFESTLDFLDMHGKDITDFLSILLTTSIPHDLDGQNPNVALEELAKKAIEKDCDYVTDIHTLGHTSLLVGTGLYNPKKYREIAAKKD